MSEYATNITVEYKDGEVVDYDDVVFHSICYEPKVLLIRTYFDEMKESYLINFDVIKEVTFYGW